ncbi:MAG: hypothetical protein WBQ94_25835 [Terracidiphilus sp.]
MSDVLNPLRVVIQQLRASPAAGYRVIVYGDEFKPRHSDFDSQVALLEALEAAIPELDISHLRLNPLREGQGSIVFDGEMPLSKKQLSTLGLK